MNSRKPTDYQARARDGDRFLLVAPGTDPMRPACVHDVAADSISEKKPLQVWFKWAEWDDCTQAEYETAVQAHD